MFLCLNIYFIKFIIEFINKMTNVKNSHQTVPISLKNHEACRTEKFLCRITQFKNQEGQQRNLNSKPCC